MTVREDDRGHGPLVAAFMFIGMMATALIAVMLTLAVLWLVYEALWS